mgnify:CR=1 FL=1
MTEHLDRYGCVIPTLNPSPAAVERRRARRVATVKATDAWGARWWRRRRAYIEEHDPFTPFDVPYPDDARVRDPWDGESQ